MASFKNLISNTSAQIASGGTISGDLVINGDLQVDGGGSLSFDEIVQGTSTIKVTDTSAFLIEKADGTDVMVVDTTNSEVTVSGNATFNAALMINSSSANYADLTVGGTGDIVALRASSGTAGFTMYEAGTGRFNMTTLNGSNGIAFKTPSTTRMIIDDNSRISLSNNDNGTSNTVFGKSAGLDLISGGNNNNFFGELAGTNVTTGDENIAIGKESLQSAQTAVANISIGNQSLQDLTFNGASYNTAVGYQSGYDLISGIKNVFVGAFTGYATTDVDNTVIIGYNAGAANMTSAADGTVAIGTFSLDALTSGARNMAAGYNAGTGITTGTDNTLVGWGAGDGLTGAATSNTLIGAEAEASSGGATNQIAIGAAAVGQGSNTVVLGKSSVSAVYAARNASASVEASAFNVGSDRKLKKNIRDTALQGINLIDQMQVRDFEWKDNDVTVNGGLIAQELEEIYPDAVGKRNDDGDDGDTTMTISRESIVPLLIKAVQELSAKVKELENK